MTHSALLTDLYQLTMMQAYFLANNNETATFECYIRSQASNRNFYVAMGINSVLDYLNSLKFSAQELDYLEKTNLFKPDFLFYLKEFSFTGDVWAMSEGEIFFAKEPVIRITAPLLEAQLVESCLINILHYQTLLASKAARCVLQAPDKVLFDFGLRRAHGESAAMMAAYASVATGFQGSATVSAGFNYQLPIVGTMAHSFIQAFPDEYSAFKAFAKSQPDNIILLIDTYDTLTGIDNVIKLSQETNYVIKGVRIDSGDLLALSKIVREKLDAANLKSVKIFVSGNIDEYQLNRLTSVNAPIDGYGIGTRLVTSEDCPSLDMVYKLQKYKDKNTMKYSPGKVSVPGIKQVFRQFTKEGQISKDILGLSNEAIDGDKLLKPVMKNGELLIVFEDVGKIQANVKTNLSKLPFSLRQLDSSSITAELSDGITQLLT